MTTIFFVFCLDPEHAWAAFEEATCAKCERLPLRILLNCLDVFKDNGRVHSPQAQHALTMWGLQVELAKGAESDVSLSHSSELTSSSVGGGSMYFGFPQGGG